MIKIITPLILIANFIYADIKEYSANQNLNKSEFRAAAFIPSSSNFREIYGAAGLSLQVEQARIWKNHENLEIWGNVEWIFMNGKPRQSCGSTDLDILNISFGLKSIGRIYRDFVFLYAGIGPDVGIVFLENKMRCCSGCENRIYKEKISKALIGGIIKAGAQIFFTTHFYLDIFADYLYLPVHFKNTSDMGGLKLGGGLSARY